MKKIGNILLCYTIVNSLVYKYSLTDWQTNGRR